MPTTILPVAARLRLMNGIGKLSPRAVAAVPLSTPRLLSWS